MTWQRATKHLEPYHFKKGQSGNPSGARNYNNRRRSAKEVSTECLNRISHALFDGSLDELKELMNAEDVTPIERLFIGVVMKAFEKGDAFALNIILDRFMGKVSEKLTVKAVASDGAPAIGDVTDEELANRRRVLAEANDV